MAKVTKREPLVVGQRVFIEIYGGWVASRARDIHEYEVVAANKASAYAVSVEDVEKYRSDEKKYHYFKVRINLKTHEIPIDSIGYSRRLWLTKKDFERSVELQKEKAELLKQAQEKVKGMTLQQLREFVEVQV